MCACVKFGVERWHTRRERSSSKLVHFRPKLEECQKCEILGILIFQKMTSEWVGNGQELLEKSWESLDCATLPLWGAILPVGGKSKAVCHVVVVVSVCCRLGSTVQHAARIMVYFTKEWTFGRAALHFWALCGLFRPYPTGAQSVGKGISGLVW